MFLYVHIHCTCHEERYTALKCDITRASHSGLMGTDRNSIRAQSNTGSAEGFRPYLTPHPTKVFHFVLEIGIWLFLNKRIGSLLLNYPLQ